MVPTPPTPVTHWVGDSGDTNHTPPNPGHTYSPRPPSFIHLSSIVVGNDSILPVTSVDDSMHPRPFYLNDVLVPPDLVQSLLSVRRFTIDNYCSIESDPFGLSVKDLTTRHVLTKYDNTDPLYTLPLHTSLTTPQCVVSYALATIGSSATWHRCLDHPDPDVLSKLSSSSVITCP
jgi:hypothetical protein